jgi:hypothetical protein
MEIRTEIPWSAFVRSFTIFAVIIILTKFLFQTHQFRDAVSFCLKSGLLQAISNYSISLHTWIFSLLASQILDKKFHLSAAMSSNIK